ncbi:hypothetical protein LY632_02960 [Erythrobacter sp. SDW2]|uniref:hypothetical protein n=1 Tax=Erythrobacter sp. SDW2 TaxID=2907154 RepID=UPI001F2DABBD|nr:hypothetical protein [Erythrobacter sp. SDW2]UIP07375.1 hypothetical protein LY632_02960 [Erythrobacter sp. SDW2]
MRSEVTRIAGNYLRLMAGFVIGLLLVRQLLNYGSDIFNIFTIVTVGAGVGIMLRELLRIALTSHLSEAWAGRDEAGGHEAFRGVFRQAMALSAVACLVGLALMAMLALALPRLDIAAENIGAARVFVGARAVILAATVLISPLLTMLMVMQRFGRMNTLMTLERVADFIAVLLPLVLLAPGFEGGSALILFGLASAALTSSLYLFAAWRIVREAPELLRPGWSWGALDKRKALTRSILWALALVFSFNLYLRFDTFFINAHFGAAATIAFGLTVQLIGMVRQLTAGIVMGLDAVAAKFRFGAREADRGGGFDRILALSNYLQTIISGSAIVMLSVWLDELLQLWVGGRVPDASVLELTRSLVLVMLFGIAAIALSDGWAGALDGTGKNRLYVRYTATLAAANAAALLVLGQLGLVTPLGLAFLFSGLLAIGHLLIVPQVYAKETGVPVRTLLAPILRGMPAPALSAAVSLTLHDRLAALHPLAAVIISGSIVGLIALADVALYLRGTRTSGA